MKASAFRLSRPRKPTSNRSGVVVVPTIVSFVVVVVVVVVVIPVSSLVLIPVHSSMPDGSILTK